MLHTSSLRFFLFQIPLPVFKEMSSHVCANSPANRPCRPPSPCPDTGLVPPPLVSAINISYPYKGQVIKNRGGKVGFLCTDNLFSGPRFSVTCFFLDHPPKWVLFMNVLWLPSTCCKSVLKPPLEMFSTPTKNHIFSGPTIILTCKNIFIFSSPSLQNTTLPFIVNDQSLMSFYVYKKCICEPDTSLTLFLPVAKSNIFGCADQ